MRLNLFATTGKNSLVASVDTRLDANIGDKLGLVMNMGGMQCLTRIQSRRFVNLVSDSVIRKRPFRRKRPFFC
ncbi:MAG: hypothetical protein M5U34_26075 [Chloroflexi bacterium]|nr:hypothetical protein [Chloroflexota bacterium]